MDGGYGDNSVYVGLFSTDPTMAKTGTGSVSALAGPLNVTDTSGQTSLIIGCSDDGFAYFQVFDDHVTFTEGPTIHFQTGSRILEGMGKLEGFVPRGITSSTIYLWEREGP